MSSGRGVVAYVARVAELALSVRAHQTAVASPAVEACTVGACRELHGSFCSEAAPRWLQKVPREVWEAAGNQINEFSSWERTRDLLFILVPIGIFVWILIVFKVGWEKKMNRRARELKVNRESDNLAQTILHHYIPSIAVGGYKFQGIKKKEQTIALSFEELGLELSDGRKVLNGVTGHFDAGKLIAIMGPSGAGKTTFLNALCGRATYGTVTGTTRVNGEICCIEDFKNVMGFVPQDDIVHEKLTVRENIAYSVELRSPVGTTPSELKAIAVDVLNVLQIGHIQMSIVGGVEERGISGGQRKRVNIGLELAATPTLLFLDEPTSGLDSSSSLAIINSLKKMTELGMTIIMVIHQPRYSIFTLFDSVLLLGKGGTTAYLGSSLKAKSYFESLGFRAPVDDNPADWLMDVISGDIKCDRVSGSAIMEVRHGSSSLGTDTAGVGVGEQLSRAWSMDDDRHTVENSLAQEFDKFDEDRSGSLSREEFRKLATHLLLGRRPSEGAFEELCAKLFGRGESQKEAVTQAEFIQFIMDASGGLQQMQVDRVRTDRAVVTPALNVPVEFVEHVVHAVAQNLGGGTASNVRVLPGFFKQYFLICHRRLVQVWRNSFRRLLDLIVLAAAGAIVGVQHRGTTEQAPSIFLVLFALSLFLPVNALRCLGADRLMFNRERSSGLNGFAYAFARMTVDSADVVLQAMVYITCYYLVAQPAIPSKYYLSVVLLQAAAVSGWGYLISVGLPAQNTMLAAVVVMLILNGVLGNPQYAANFIDGGLSELILSISPTRWGLQMLFIEQWIVRNEVPRDSRLHLVLVYKSQALDQGQALLDAAADSHGAGAEMLYEENKDKGIGSHWSSSVWVLLGQAAFLRVVATIVLCYGDRVPGPGTLATLLKRRLSKPRPRAIPTVPTGVPASVASVGAV